MANEMNDTMEILNNELMDDYSYDRHSNQSTTSSSTSIAIEPKKINAYRKRQREELTYLRTKVNELQDQLIQLKLKHKKFELNKSPWKILATQLRAEKERAINDNNNWRQALQEQIEFIHALHTILKKKPRLSMISTLGDAQWKMLRLSINSNERYDTALSIVNHQYSLLPSILVASGMINIHTEFTTCIPKSINDDLLVVEATACRRYPSCDFQLWGQMAWMVITGEFPNTSESFQILETYSNDMVYINTPCKILNMDGQCRDVVKRFIEPTREIIIFRSILHDDLIPLTKQFISNEMAWMVIEPILPNGSIVKFFNKATPPTIQQGNISTDPSTIEKIIDGLILHSSKIMNQFEIAMKELIPLPEIYDTSNTK